MMNRTAAVFFLFFRRPGEYLPLFWLAGAFVLGFLWSLTYASGLVAEEPLPWPAGRLMFAFYGMLVYGWALPILFSFAAGSRSRWMKPAEWLWHTCVALGLATIAAGNGSGVLLMPFDWWVCPVFAFLAAGAACVAWFRPFPWPVRLLFSSSAGCVAAALWALGYTQALSMNGLLDVSALGGSLSCGLMFAALGAAALRLDMAQGRGSRNSVRLDGPGAGGGSGDWRAGGASGVSRVVDVGGGRYRLVLVRRSSRRPGGGAFLDKIRYEDRNMGEDRSFPACLAGGMERICCGCA